MFQAQAGVVAGISWQTEAGLSYDSAPTLTVTNLATLETLATVPEVTDLGGGVYTAAWLPPVDTAEGTYRLSLLEEIEFVETTTSALVYVSSDWSYVTLDAFKSTVRPGVTSLTDDDRMWGVLCGVSRQIDSECNRTFRVPTVSTSKRYDCGRSIVNDDGTGLMYVDDIATPVGVAVAVASRFRTPVTIDPTWWRLEDPEQSGHPWLALTRNVPWPRGLEATITASWGWPKTPPQVIEAVIMQARRVWSRRGAPEGTSGPMEWGIVKTPRLDPDVRTMLTGLIRIGVS